MKRTYILVIILALFTGFTTIAQPVQVKTNHSVIIDTDCAIDDLRAISLMIARPELKVSAIIVSDGSLSPADGAGKVSSLLHQYNIDNIPIIQGETITGINPPWRRFNEEIRWGESLVTQKSIYKTLDYIPEILKKSDEKIILVCLGPLTNIAQILKNDVNIKSSVERIVWYNDSAGPLEGFNYECDKKSADFVFKSGLRIDVISNHNKENNLFDSSMLSVCQNSKTNLAMGLRNVFMQPPVLEKLQQKHFNLCDDLVTLYITNPELFVMNINPEQLNIRYNTDFDVVGIKTAMADMINGIYVTERNVVFNRFPVQPEMFNYDIRPILDSAIARYGYQEWKANVMTDEFHGHLGVFSIVGAKMGIRARELFNVGADMLVVTTYAGSRPPYSCLNDGIQVSTGATVGMGTIHVATDKKASPAAVFTYNNRSVKISLKKEYLEKVDADINEGIMKFGLLDDGYWKLIRRNAIKYWLEWDRKEIFDVEEVKVKNN